MLLMPICLILLACVVLIRIFLSSLVPLLQRPQSTKAKLNLLRLIDMTIMIKTGRTGSGKTLHAMTLIEKYLKEGKTVYTNIRGISINGVVRIMDDFEWWTMPVGGVMIIDEAQNSIYYQKDHWRKLTEAEKVHRAKLLSRLNTHRHHYQVEKGDEWDQAGDFTLVFMTQDATALDPWLKIADVHQHSHRPKKQKYAHIFEWDRYQGFPDAKTNQLTAVKTTFLFNKHKRLFNYYDSIQSATADRAKFPNIVIFAVLLPVIFVLYGLKGIFLDRSIDKAATGDTQKVSTAQVQDVKFKPVDVAETTASSDQLKIAPYISMCSASYPKSDGGCICRDGGDVLMLDTDQCYTFAANPRLWSHRQTIDKGADDLRDAAQARNADQQAPTPVSFTLGL